MTLTVDGRILSSTYMNGMIESDDRFNLVDQSAQTTSYQRVSVCPSPIMDVSGDYAVSFADDTTNAPIYYFTISQTDASFHMMVGGAKIDEWGDFTIDGSSFTGFFGGSVESNGDILTDTGLKFTSSAPSTAHLQLGEFYFEYDTADASQTPTDHYEIRQNGDQVTQLYYGQEMTQYKLVANMLFGTLQNGTVSLDGEIAWDTGFSMKEENVVLDISGKYAAIQFFDFTYTYAEWFTFE